MLFKTIEDVLYPTQKELFQRIQSYFKSHVISKKNGYILVQGSAPIMLVAHLDTVHKESVRNICKSNDGNILMSPQGIGGDDRCGVYALINIYNQCQQKPWLLFTCDEEIGGIGAQKFIQDYYKKIIPRKLSNLKAIIEIDRKGKDEAVYYDCNNVEFEKYITQKGFTTQAGSYTDVADIGPELGVAIVNLSSGYYNAHTLHEYICLNHLETTIQRVIEIIGEASLDRFPKYEYVELSKLSQYDTNPFFYDWTTSAEHDPKNIPYFIRDEYFELLEYYTPEELNDLIEQEGADSIHDLYNIELGCFVENNEEKDDETDD